jgi:hypothetical protein
VLYPNPSTGRFTIENAQGAMLYVLDITGKLLFTKEIKSDLEVVDITHLVSGLYVLKIVSDTDIKSAKIIKQ